MILLGMLTMNKIKKGGKIKMECKYCRYYNPRRDTCDYELDDDELQPCEYLEEKELSIKNMKKEIKKYNKN